MKTNNIYILLLLVVSCMISINNVQAQSFHKVQNLPFADQKLYHLGFLVGLHTQDMVLYNSGHVGAGGQAWFTDIPSYSPGFSVGIIGGRYLNEYFNVRISPTMHFGEKKFVFKEQTSGDEYETTLRSNYLTLPVHLKFSGTRMQNVRPYFLVGGYASMGIGIKKNQAIRYEKMDYGLDFGVGCNIYLPLFRLCPELRFSLGLTDLIDTDKSDISDMDMIKYREAVHSGKTRMISLIFNFE